MPSWLQSIGLGKSSTDTNAAPPLKPKSVNIPSNPAPAPQQKKSVKPSSSLSNLKNAFKRNKDPAPPLPPLPLPNYSVKPRVESSMTSDFGDIAASSAQAQRRALFAASNGIPSERPSTIHTDGNTRTRSVNSRESNYVPMRSSSFFAPSTMNVAHPFPPSNTDARASTSTTPLQSTEADRSMTPSSLASSERDPFSASPKQRLRSSRSMPQTRPATMFDPSDYFSPANVAQRKAQSPLSGEKSRHAQSANFDLPETSNRPDSAKEGPQVSAPLPVHEAISFPPLSQSPTQFQDAEAPVLGNISLSQMDHIFSPEQSLSISKPTRKPPSPPVDQKAQNARLASGVPQGSTDLLEQIAKRLVARPPSTADSFDSSTDDEDQATPALTQTPSAVARPFTNSPDSIVPLQEILNTSDPRPRYKLNRESAFFDESFASDKTAAVASLDHDGSPRARALPHSQGLTGLGLSQDAYPVLDKGHIDSYATDADNAHSDALQDANEGHMRPPLDTAGAPLTEPERETAKALCTPTFTFTDATPPSSPGSGATPPRPRRVGIAVDLDDDEFCGGNNAQIFYDDYDEYEYEDDLYEDEYSDEYAHGHAQSSFSDEEDLDDPSSFIDGRPFERTIISPVQEVDEEDEEQPASYTDRAPLANDVPQTPKSPSDSDDENNARNEDRIETLTVSSVNSFASSEIMSHDTRSLQSDDDDISLSDLQHRLVSHSHELSRDDNETYSASGPQSVDDEHLSSPVLTGSTSESTTLSHVGEASGGPSLYSSSDVSFDASTQGATSTDMHSTGAGIVPQSSENPSVFNTQVLQDYIRQQVQNQDRPRSPTNDSQRSNVSVGQIASQIIRDLGIDTFDDEFDFTQFDQNVIADREPPMDQAFEDDFTPTIDQPAMFQDERPSMFHGDQPTDIFHGEQPVAMFHGDQPADMFHGDQPAPMFQEPYIPHQDARGRYSFSSDASSVYEDRSDSGSADADPFADVPLFAHKSMHSYESCASSAPSPSRQTTGATSHSSEHHGFEAFKMGNLPDMWSAPDRGVPNLKVVDSGADKDSTIINELLSKLHGPGATQAEHQGTVQTEREIKSPGHPEPGAPAPTARPSRNPFKSTNPFVNAFADPDTSLGSVRTPSDEFWASVSVESFIDVADVEQADLFH